MATQDFVNLAQTKARTKLRNKSKAKQYQSAFQKFRGADKRMAPGTPVIFFIISLVLVLLVCCLSRALIVPMAQASNNEMNTRKYLDKEEKRAFFNKMIEN